MSEPPTIDRPHGLAERLVALGLGRPVSVTMLVLAVVVTGVLAFQRTPVQLMPGGLSFPGMFVQIPYPNAGPREVEERLTRPVEELLGTVSQLRTVSSTSGESGARLMLQFVSSADMDVAYAEVSDRLERAARDFPPEVERFRVYKFNPTEAPIYALAATYDPARVEHPFDVLRTRIAPELEQLDGVAKVNLEGMLARQVRVRVDAGRLQAHQVRLNEVRQTLTRDVFSADVGMVSEHGRRHFVRVDARFHDLDEVRNLPVNDHVRLRDVAEVVEADAIEEFLTLLDDRPMVVLELQKQSDANTIETCERIEARLAALAADEELAGFRFVPLFDQGRLVRFSLDQLAKALFWGGLFALAVLLMFLRRLRLTLLITLSIPGSMTMALVVLYFQGRSINLLSLMGFTLAVGMLIDNSIVVVESIFRARAQGLAPRRAAFRGTADVALAILMATGTTIVVFVPLWLMADDALFGAFMAEIGGPVCYALAASLLVALGVIPLATLIAAPASGEFRVASSEFRGEGEPPGEPSGRGPVGATLVVAPGAATRVATPVPPDPGTERSFIPAIARLRRIASHARAAADRVRHVCRQAGAAADRVLAPAGRGIERGLEALRAGYLRALGWVLAHRSETALLVVLLAALTMKMLAALPTADQRAGESREIHVRVDLPESSTWQQAQALLRRFQAPFLEEATRRELDLRFVRARFRPTGGNFNFYLTEGDARTRPQNEIEEAITARFPNEPGVRFRLGWHGGGRGSGSAPAASVMLQGRNMDVLADLAVEVERRLEALPSVLSAETDVAERQRELHVRLRPETVESAGVDPELTGALIRTGLSGSRLPDYRSDDFEIPMILEFDQDLEQGVGLLHKLAVPTAGGGALPLEVLATTEQARGFGEIRHQDRKAALVINVATHEEDLVQLQQDLEAALKTLELPPGYEWKLGERFESWRRDQDFGIQAGVRSLIFVFLLMGILFESFLLPFSVLISVPLAGIGAFGMLWVTGTPLDMMALMGAVILVGIVVNNAIVLVDKINRLRRAGLTRRDALREAAHARFRPIIMTALTTIFGLMPMAFGEEGALISYAALGKCVLGGLISSTLLTLFLVPMFYTVLDDLAAAARRSRVVRAVLGAAAVLLGGSIMALAV